MNLKLALAGLLVGMIGVASVSAQEDSLLAVLQRTTTDSVKARILIELSKVASAGSLPRSEEYAKRSLKVALALADKRSVALAHTQVGIVQFRLGSYKSAVESFQKALVLFHELGDISNESRLNNNLGAVYNTQGLLDKALEYCIVSLRLAEQIGDTLRLMSVLSNLATIHGTNEKTYHKAIEFNRRALDLALKFKDSQVIGTVAVNLGELYFNQGNDAEALRLYGIAVDAAETAGELPFILVSIGRVYSRKGDYHAADNFQMRALKISDSLGLVLDRATALVALGNTRLRQKDYKGAIAFFSKANRLSDELGVSEELKSTYYGLALSYAALGNYKGAFTNFKLYSEMRDTIYTTEFDQKMSGQLFDYEMNKKQNQISLLNKDKVIADELARKQTIVQYATLIGLILVVVILLIMYRNYRVKVKLNDILDGQNVKIETLLQNILPSTIARELQSTGRAKSRFYESASVLFADFKDFTLLADGLTPSEIVDELNEHFSVFDDIVHKFNVEKIKTIGDAYMCASGIPDVDPMHALNIVRAAIEILQYLEQKNAERIAAGKAPWQIRIGIHSGPLAAGVVGKRKYAYDIWGSTVNIASRMESNSEPGRINVSSATYQLVQSEFICQHRGKIKAKNVGEIDMYFVESGS